MADFSDFNRLAWYYQGLIVVGVAGGLLALVWWQVLTPLQAEVDTKQGQLDQLNQEIAVAAQRQLQLAQIKADALELQQELDDLKPILPSERETDDVLRQVEAAARVSSLRILRLSPRPDVDHEVYTEWPLDMQVQATYHNMGRFLDRIRQLDRIVNVTRLSLNASGDGVTTSVSATFTATTFVYKEEEPPPPPAPAN